VELAGSVLDSGGRSGIPELPCPARRRRLHRPPPCRTSWPGRERRGCVAERADVRSGTTGSPQQLGSAQWCSLGVVLFFNAIPAALLAHVFAEQLPGLGIEQANVQLIPLHSKHTTDPARRRAVVGGFDFDAAIQMHDALAVLV